MANSARTYRNPSFNFIFDLPSSVYTLPAKGMLRADPNSPQSTPRPVRISRLDANEGNALLFASCIVSLRQSVPQKPRCHTVSIVPHRQLARRAHSSAVDNSIKIARIDSLAGKSKLQHVHLFRSVKYF